MAKDLLPYKPIAGINADKAAVALEPTECAHSANFLFERGMVVTRPALTVQDLFSGPAGSFVYGKVLSSGIANYNIVIDSLDKLYGMVKVTSIATIEITGAGITFGSRVFHNMDIVNGAVMVGNSIGGIVRADLETAATYTVIADAKYRYVTAHLSRAIGAYDTDGSALLGPRTLGWSVAGDETDWTGTGSGSTVLSDAPDNITGVGVINNIVIVVRRGGFHHGYPTGAITPTFRFENQVKQGPGCPYPSTVVFDDNKLFYVGPDNVYVYNSSESVPIGTNIRRELIRNIRSGYSYRGLVTRSLESSPRSYYHLIQEGPPAYSSLELGFSGCRHFIYSIDDNTWSRHTYGIEPSGCWPFTKSIDEIFLVMGSGTALYRWDETAALDTPAELRSGVLTIGSPANDVKIVRALLRYQDLGATEAVIGLRGRDAGVEQVVSLAGENDQQWKRAWVDLRTGGQDFEISLKTSKHLAFDYIGLDAAEEGVFRG